MKLENKVIIRRKNNNQRLFNKVETAFLFGISPNLLSDWVEDGSLMSEKIDFPICLFSWETIYQAALMKKKTEEVLQNYGKVDGWED